MRFICFETDDGVYHFEVNSPSTWVEVIGEVFAQKSFEEAKNKINELNEENNANQEAIKTLGLNISEENTLVEIP